MIKTMKTLNNICRAQSVYRNKAIGENELLPTHFAFVLVICKFPNRSQEDIAKELCLDKSTVARTLSYLEAHGYVTRLQNEVDKRQYLVCPTEKMLSVFPKIKRANKKWNAIIEDGILKEDLEVFYKVLSQMEEKAKIFLEGEEVEKQ